MIFQELIPNALQARVSVVGRERFVAAVAPGDVVDVRTEINTVSFFDHVEAHAELPISWAVADLLHGFRRSRVQRAA